MTQEQKNLFENALERALKNGIEVVGVGLADDQKCMPGSSRSRGRSG